MRFGGIPTRTHTWLHNRMSTRAGFLNSFRKFVHCFDSFAALNLKRPSVNVRGWDNFRIVCFVLGRFLALLSSDFRNRSRK